MRQHELNSYIYISQKDTGLKKSSHNNVWYFIDINIEWKYIEEK